MVVLGAGGRFLMSEVQCTPVRGRHAYTQSEASCKHDTRACYFKGENAGVESGPFFNLRFHTHEVPMHRFDCTAVQLTDLPNVSACA